MLKYGPAELDYFALSREAKKLDVSKCASKLKVAVLGDFATQHLVTLLKVLYSKNSIAAEIYESEFDTIDLELADPASGLRRSGARHVVFMNAVQALRQRYYDSPARASFAADTVAAIVRRWDAVRAGDPSAVAFQTNFPLPEERFFGQFDLKVPGSFSSAVRAVNAGLAEAAAARDHVRLLDIESLASHFGRRQWSSEKLWTLYKQFCALEYLPHAAQCVVDVSASLLGAGVKCMVLDLDNTLWGGVIGDDGVEGIKVGHLDEGEAYTNFQCFLRELKRRGILLAACSKNDPANAVLPFRNHPEMVLKESDFAAFVANWNNKADNIRAIQAALNIGFDSMVFVDDDAFERNLVRECVPGVIVPEMPADPADYVRALSELNLFETSAFSAEDAGRTELYRAEAERKLAEKSFSTPEEYLKSLGMRAVLARFDSAHLPRVAQLMQRSNQFNLCTRRFSEGECEAFMRDADGHYPFYLKLSDRFSDAGLVSAVVLKLEKEAVRVEEWVMSCRVLLRGVEQHAMNFVVDLAKKRGAKRVVGRYVPTEKNGMVKGFYAQFGFKKTAEAPDGAVDWALDVEEYSARPVYFVKEAL